MGRKELWNIAKKRTIKKELLETQTNERITLMRSEMERMAMYNSLFISPIEAYLSDYLTSSLFYVFDQSLFRDWQIVVKLFDNKLDIYLFKIEKEIDIREYTNKREMIIEGYMYSLVGVPDIMEEFELWHKIAFIDNEFIYVIESEIGYEILQKYKKEIKQKIFNIAIEVINETIEYSLD